MLASRKVAQSSKRARAGPRLPPRRRYCPSSETVTEDLILTGAGLTATYSLDYRPVDQVWSRVTVLLHEAAGWVLQGSGQAPTRAQFEAILAGAAELRIRADYRNEPLSTAFLDNVALTGLPFIGAAFDPPPGDFSLLARNADGTYTRTLKDGTRLAYDSDGRLVAVVDRNGNETAYAYNADGTLQSVSDPGDPNRAVALDYLNGELASVTDVSGRITAFALNDTGDLAAVTLPDGAQRRFVYDQNKRLVNQVSERGFVTQLSYGNAGQLAGATFPDGASVAMSIGSGLGLDLGTETNPRAYLRPEDRVSDLTDALGNPYQMELNQYGGLIRLTDPIGRVKRIERDSNNIVTRVQKATDYDPSGFVTTDMVWDSLGNVVSRTEAAGTALAQTTRYEYEPVFNNVTKVIDASNSDPAPACGTRGVTCYEYDANGNQTKMTGPDGAIESFTYDARGRRLSATDARGNVTTLVYNVRGNLESITNAAGITARYFYDNAGNNTEIVEANGTPEARTTTFSYDAQGRVILQTDPSGTATHYSYDAEGNPVAETTEFDRETLLTYDPLGRIATVSNPDLGTYTYGYDENGNAKEIVDPLGGTIRYRYDAVNRRIDLENPELGTYQFSYDAQDNQIQVVGARGYSMSFLYDLLGRQVGHTDALGGTWSRTFDSVDNVLKETDAKGQTKEHSYDSANRWISTTARYADGTVADVHTFSYDASGNLLTAKDNDSSLNWAYDDLDRVVMSSTKFEFFTVQPSVTLNHNYDAFNNRRAVEATMGSNQIGTTRYDYTPDELLARVTAPSGETVDVIYDSLDRTTSLLWGSSARTALNFDPSNPRPDEIIHGFGESKFVRFAYGYDLDGKVISINGPRGTRNLTYDRKQQVTVASRAAEIESYNYDADGNRVSSHLSSIYSFDTANQLIEDANHCYFYDANGNLTRKVKKIDVTCAGQVTVYEWDTLDQLVRINFEDGTYTAYRYDVQGRRIEKDVNGRIIRYVYDGNNIVLEFDSADVLIARYTHGLSEDQPLTLERGGVSYSYHADERGSIRLIMDSAGNITNRYDYDSFGNLEGLRFAQVDNPFGFTGREWDLESGLYYYRARYYDPTVGRFLSRDPIGIEAGDFTLYSYVRNNPHNFRDPYGLFVLGTYAAQTCVSSALGSVTGGFFGALAATLLNEVDVALSGVSVLSTAILLQEALAAASEAAGIEILAIVATGGCGRGGGGGSKHVSKRVTREARWLQLAREENSRLPKEVIDHILRHNGANVTKRFGLELAHRPGKSNAQGYDYSDTIPKTAADHRGIQHRYLTERKWGTRTGTPKRKRGKGKLSLPPRGALP